MRDRKGFTPLQHALRGPRNRECAVILLESGAQFDVDIFETDYGTLLHEMYVSDDTAHLLRLTELMLATGPEDLATAVTCNDGDTLLNKLLKFFGSARPRDRDEYVDEVIIIIIMIVIISGRCFSAIICCTAIAIVHWGHWDEYGPAPGGRQVRPSCRLFESESRLP